MIDITNMYFNYNTIYNILQVDGRNKFMIISLCGDIENKIILLNEFKKEYGDKLVIWDYFEIAFRTVIENEKQKYDLIDNCSNLKEARKLFNDLIDKIMSDKFNTFCENNKDKIILLITDNVICVDIDKTEFFDKSDLKILSIYNSLDNESEEDYDESLFDYVVKNNEKIDIKKLVKLC